MTVRAKFKVDSITRSRYYGSTGELHTIKLTPVSSGSEENKSFFASSPHGALELGCVNPDAAKLFELGAEYYLDFTKAN